VNDVLTRAPWAWRLLRRPVTRFFDRAARGWDERYASDPSRLVPLSAALDRLRPGGHVVCVASRGRATPFFTPAVTLARGFGRHGLETVAAEAAGPGTYYLARRP
jgi:hypothetical protein